MAFPLKAFIALTLVLHCDATYNYCHSSSFILPAKWHLSSYNTITHGQWFQNDLTMFVSNNEGILQPFCSNKLEVPVIQVTIHTRMATSVVRSHNIRLQDHKIYLCYARLFKWWNSQRTIRYNTRNCHV